MMKDLDEEREARIAANIIPGLSVTLGQLRSSTSRLLADKTNVELATVIEHLSRVAEKLKTENEILKKNGGTSNFKYMEMLKELKALRKERSDAVELAKARAAADAQVQKWVYLFVPFTGSNSYKTYHTESTPKTKNSGVN
jgi:hypothetical protein